jgi:cysteine-rich repeat protein
MLQSGDGEQCDNGTNVDTYDGCAPGCVRSARCGDGNVDYGFGEQCDEGMANMDGAYGGCQSDCTRGPHCGDGVMQMGEACDDGTNLSSYDGCAPGCQLAPFCGDGTVDTAHGEQCDEGMANMDGLYGGCGTDCALGPRCGDGVVQGERGERCDDGNRIPFDTCSNECLPTLL